MDTGKIAPTLLSASDIVDVAMPFAEIIKIVEETYGMAGRGQVEVPTKIGVHPEHKGSFLHAMPAWAPEARALGMKWISYFPGNMQRGLPDSSGIIVLNHPDHGLPVAIMEGMWITYARTAACAAVMAKYLATSAPTRLGLVGCGGLGHWSLRMLSELFPSLSDVTVTSRTPASREKFAAEMSAAGPWRIRPVAELREAVAGQDIVVSSIPAPPAPIIPGAWLSPGALAIHLDVIGTWDTAGFRSVDRFVTDDYMALKGFAARAFPGWELPGATDFASVVIGREPAREGPDQKIFAIPTGVASVDMTLAWIIYERARERGIGKTVVLS